MSIFGAPAASGNNIFGTPAATGGSLFGGAAATTTPAAPASTPSIFGAPTASGQPTKSIFGTPATSQPPGTSLFGAANPATQSTTPAPATTSIFGAPAANPSAATTTPATSLFGAPKPGGTSIFGAPPTATASNPTAPTSLFGAPAKPADASSATPAPPSIFGAPAKPAEGSTATPSTNLFGGGGGLFGAKPTATPSTTAPAAAGASSAPGIGLFGKPADNTAAPTAAGANPLAGGLFGAASKPAEVKKDGASNPAAPTSSIFGGASLFGGAKPDGIAKATSQDPAIPGACLALTANTTPGVAVAPPSVLRGKTVEEIVNKWSSDLEANVTEFHRFAGEVAAWDRALIENGNNLAALYGHVLSAEREQNDIDQALDHVEQQQRDLSATLDAYEKVTQEIFGGHNGGIRALDTGPADTERDKNYMLATDLHTHLEDLSGSLTQMIETVNTLSGSSNPDGTRPDQPIAQIAQILSSHLESLQWIDGAVRDVEGKVSEVEKRVKESNYSSGLGNSTAQKSRGFGLR